MSESELFETLGKLIQMKHLIKLFRSRNSEVTSVNIRDINDLIGQIDESTNKIFYSNAIKLSNEPLTNVVAAVCGFPSDKSKPTSSKRQIDDTIRPMIQRIKNTLKAEVQSAAKDCVIDCVIKRLAILEILFMIQCYKLNVLSREQSKSMDFHNLVDIQVAGHA